MCCTAGLSYKLFAKQLKIDPAETNVKVKNYMIKVVIFIKSGAGIHMNIKVSCLTNNFKCTRFDRPSSFFRFNL